MFESTERHLGEPKQLPEWIPCPLPESVERKANVQRNV